MVAKISLIIAGAYTLALCLLSLVQLGKVSIGSFHPTDKFLHAVAYLILVGVWMLYFILNSENFSGYRSFLYKISGLAVCFGTLIEISQGALTDYREADWLDILANTTGVLLAVILFLILERALKRIKGKINLFL